MPGRRQVRGQDRAKGRNGLLLVQKKLEEGNRMSKEERKEAEQEKFNNIPEKVLQNDMVQRMVERVHEIQDAEDVLDPT
jgi:hypothetical protein